MSRRPISASGVGANRVLAATLFAHESAGFAVHGTAGLGDAGCVVSGAADEFAWCMLCGGAAGVAQRFRQPAGVLGQAAGLPGPGAPGRLASAAIASGSSVLMRACWPAAWRARYPAMARRCPARAASWRARAA